LNVLLREIAVQKSLKHRHIIQLYDHFEDENAVYLLLEYAPKGALFYKIRRARKMPEEEARGIFRQTVLGIGFLHKNDIIHRDLKPENLLLDSQSCIKICDFGWCVKGTDVRTTFCGTLDYMAPEMFSRGGHSFEIDLWALGVLLYEMLHGQAPFTAKNDTDKCRQIMRGEFGVDSALSREAADLIRSLMQVMPNRRLTCEGILDHPWMLLWNQKPVGAIVQRHFVGVGDTEGVVSAVHGDVCDVYFEKADQKLLIPLDEVQASLFEHPDDAEVGGLGLNEEISRRTKEICPDYQETPGREEPSYRKDPEPPREIERSSSPAVEVTKGYDEEPVCMYRPTKRRSTAIDESSEALTLRKQELARLAAKLQSTTVILDKPQKSIPEPTPPPSEGGFINWLGGIFGCASSR
jgi:serine/threonine protein kinase